MTIICKSCGFEGKNWGINLCKSCYDKTRRQQRNESYRRSKGLPIDHVFPQNEEKRTHCIICEKLIDQSKRTHSKKFCGACYKKEYKKNNPEAVQKARKYALEKTRRKNGLPLDHPYLIARPGEGSMTKQGYKDIWMPGHPNCKNKLGRIYEHVYVMSQTLKRPLTKGETVHHMNGIRDDNRIENLELWHRGQPAGQRVEDRIKFYKEFLEQYGYKVTKE